MSIILQFSKSIRRTILITGATDGIGLALARFYRARSQHVVLVGRKPLAQFSPPLFTHSSYCQADLARTDCVTVIQRFLREQEIGGIDLLIHNAAVGYYGPVDRQSPQSIRELLAVNLAAPVSLTHALLGRITGCSGKIVFILSAASALACPEYAVYAATKVALDGFARNLRIELRGSARVQVIHPGATRTGLHAKIGLKPDVEAWQRFAPADVVARKIARAIDTRRRSVTIGLGNVLLQAVGRHFAGPLDWFLRRRRAECTV